MGKADHANVVLRSAVSPGCGGGLFGVMKVAEARRGLDADRAKLVFAGLPDQDWVMFIQLFMTFSEKPDDNCVKALDRFADDSCMTGACASLSASVKAQFSTSHYHNRAKKLETTLSSLLTYSAKFRDHPFGVRIQVFGRCPLGFCVRVWFPTSVTFNSGFAPQVKRSTVETSVDQFGNNKYTFLEVHERDGQATFNLSNMKWAAFALVFKQATNTSWKKKVHPESESGRVGGGHAFVVFIPDGARQYCWDNGVPVPSLFSNGAQHVEPVYAFAGYEHDTTGDTMIDQQGPDDGPDDDAGTVLDQAIKEIATERKMDNGPGAPGVPGGHVDSLMAENWGKACEFFKAISSLCNVQSRVLDHELRKRTRPDGAARVSKRNRTSVDTSQTKGVQVDPVRGLLEAPWREDEDQDLEDGAESDDDGKTLGNLLEKLKELNQKQQQLLEQTLSNGAIPELHHSFLGMIDDDLHPLTVVGQGPPLTMAGDALSDTDEPPSLPMPF